MHTRTNVEAVSLWRVAARDVSTPPPRQVFVSGLEKSSLRGIVHGLFSTVVQAQPSTPHPKQLKTLQPERQR